MPLPNNPILGTGPILHNPNLGPIIPHVPRYDFSLDHFEIDNTRSRHKDTIHIMISVGVAGRNSVVLVKNLGDFNNGVFTTGMVLKSVPIADDEIAVFTYLIVNNGHSGDTAVDKTLTDVGTKIATGTATAAAKVATEAAAAAIGAWVGGIVGTTIPIVGTLVGAALGALAGALLSDLIDDINPNCDGPVASAIVPISGGALHAQLDRGQLFTQRDHNPGIDSAHGCGSNSNYYTTWSVKKSV